MKNLHIPYSYNTWSIKKMKTEIEKVMIKNYKSKDIKKVLNRNLTSMYIEWWLHNILFYLTKPFTEVPYLQKVNLRCRDVDLEEWVKKK